MEQDDLISTVVTIKEHHQICDSCLGRLFGKLSHGLTNKERGESLRIVAGLSRNKPMEKDSNCEICRGLCINLQEWVNRAIAEVSEYEFNTFLFGNRLKRGLKSNQERLTQRYQLENSEDFSHALNRRMGKPFRDRLSERGKETEADFQTPDLTVLVDFENDEIQKKIRSLYVYGRYRKLTRGIPQTVWPGEEFSTSIEEIITPPARSLSGAKSSVFHGGGREDIDVLCLGAGRPFVVELETPTTRSIDLSDLKERVNKSGTIEIEKLKKVSKSAIREIKSANPDKIYRVEVKTQKDLSFDDFTRAVRQVQGRIFQRTPTRVSHRRSDRVRVRRVFDVRGRKVGSGTYLVYIWAESGLYIKELITSDGGRSLPSLASSAGTSITVLKLDVIDIPGKLLKEGDGSYHFVQDKKCVKDVFAGLD